MEKIPMRKIREVLRHSCKLQLSIRQTARSTNTSRATVGDYRKRFEKSGIDIDTLLAMSDKEIEQALFGAAALTGKPKRPLPDMAKIHLQMQQRKQSKVTLALLWEEYRESYPDGYGYTQFCEYYRRYRNTLNPSMRQIHIAGEKCFIDYSGMTMPIVDVKSGEINKAQIFVAVLGASGYTFVHATLSQKMEDFIYSHTLAFDFFGGVPRILVPDNLKSAVIKHTRDEIVINESYALMAAHYGIAIEPARPRKPKDKPKAEQGVQGIQRWLLARLRGRTFFSVDELNEALSPLLDRYNAKIVKHLQKSRDTLFEELDKPHLGILPANSYLYRAVTRCKVHMDYHIALKKCYYSVPYTLLKEEVEVRYNTQSVEIYHNNTLVALHPRLYRIGEASTLKEHMPSHHQYANEKMNPDRLKHWAERIGKQTLAYTQKVLEQSDTPPNTYRRIVAVLSMAKSYDPAEFELALAFALQANTLQTKSIRSILDKKRYLSQSTNQTTESSQHLHDTHDNLRGKKNYR